MNSILLAANWSERQESRAHSAVKILNYLIGLSKIHPSLAAWYPKGVSKKVRVAIEMTEESVFRQTTPNRSEIDGEVIADLGCILSVWNGNSAELTVRIGASCAGVGNGLVLDSDPILSEEAWREIADLTISIFAPDNLTVSERGVGNLSTDVRGAKPIVEYTRRR